MIQNITSYLKFWKYYQFFLNEIPADLLTIYKILTVSSIFIGVVGFCVTYIVYAFLGIPPEFEICFAVFLMVFSIYSLDKLSDSKEDLTNMPERAEFLKRKSRFIYSCSIVAYLLAGLLILIVKPIGLPIIFLPIASNAVYGSKPFPRIPRLKEVPFMKNILVAFIWALVTVLLPGIQNATFSVIAFVFYFIFIKCFINTVIYDIRDIEGDRKCGIKTIPVLLGKRYTIAVLTMINTTLLLWLILTNFPHRFLYILMILYGYFYIIRFSEVENYFCLDILVDGEWIIFSLALVLLNNFSFFG